jgi:hypothetical protein
MNSEIAKIIKGQIEGLAFMDRVAGAVRVVRRQDSTDKGTIVKSFPVDCDVTQKDCVGGKYTDLVPNSKYKSIHYFEDMGVAISAQDQSSFDFEAKLRLVGWLNLQRLGKTTCSVSHLAIAAVLKTIRSDTFNSGDFTRIQIRCTGLESKTSAIFSKYSYSEEVNQYLLYPYDYYAMNFSVKFRLPYKCINDWVGSLPENCIDNGS